MILKPGTAVELTADIGSLITPPRPDDAMLVSRRPDAGVAQVPGCSPAPAPGQRASSSPRGHGPALARSATSTSTSTATTRYPPLQIFTDAQREGLSGFPARFDPEVLTASSR